MKICFYSSKADSFFEADAEMLPIPIGTPHNNPNFFLTDLKNNKLLSRRVCVP
jgi:hypothetical protein